MFSLTKEEANELIKLIRSRVVDSNGTFGETTPNMRTSAIMEARKWLQEKRLGSKKNFEMELDSPNVASPFQLWSPFSSCCFSIRSRTVYPHYSLALLGSSCNWCFYGFPE